jgi:hypothetical protein
MNRIVLGAFAALALLGIGLFWLQGRAEVERGAPPPVAPSATPEGLPSADIAGLAGPAPPEATELSREERRFFRYDRDRDRRISRNEMLSTRTDAFRPRQGRQQPAHVRGMGGHDRAAVRPGRRRQGRRTDAEGVRHHRAETRRDPGLPLLSYAATASDAWSHSPKSALARSV